MLPKVSKEGPFIFITNQQQQILTPNMNLHLFLMQSGAREPPMETSNWPPAHQGGKANVWQNVVRPGLQSEYRLVASWRCVVTRKLLFTLSAGNTAASEPCFGQAGDDTHWKIREANQLPETEALVRM